MIQKIEKWRIQELAQVLNQISNLLREGQDAAWANVFAHFAQEAHNLLDKRDLDLDSLTRLIQNIINCFDGGSSLSSLILRHNNPNRMAKLNHEFGQRKNILSEILSEMEAIRTESIN